MGDKGAQYSQYVGRFHIWKESIKEFWSNVRERNGVNGCTETIVQTINRGEANYDHLYKRKSRWDLIRISAAVMGIEFSYAAETAFVSPTLLEIGVSHKHMTLIWCLSPFIGFFLTPIMGSLSDNCRFSLGRRRPFIILLSIGVILGLLLVPNGKYLGVAFGDSFLENSRNDNSSLLQEKPSSTPNPWGVFFTILGTVFLDFHADSCQSPSRAYLLDVTLPEDHAIGLSTFTIMAGLGGSCGYAMGAMNWGYLAVLFGGHVRLVFTMVLLLFIFCVVVTLTSFQEIPLDLLYASTLKVIPLKSSSKSYDKFEEESSVERTLNGCSTEIPEKNSLLSETSFTQRTKSVTMDIEQKAAMATLTEYLWSIIHMPNSMRVLCLTNLFCWMSLVCYSLYFTDFVGASVFHGDPSATLGSKDRTLYDEGVRFGCWGMALYSLSCSCYSFIIEKLIRRFRAKRIYIGGQLIYSLGMIGLALTETKWGVLVFSWSAGVMYSTLFTFPYLVIAHYHETNTYSKDDKPGHQSVGVRGIGTDVAIVSSMVFLAQLLLSSSMGFLVDMYGSPTFVIIAASFLSFCGAITANFVTYLDL